MTLSADNPIPSRWLTWCAWLTVAAVCPLVFLGALVTTMGVGMADARAVVSPHLVVPELIQGEQGLGWRIEHSHRLAGWFAGLCSIVLAAVCWFSEARTNFRWLGLVALGLITLQGLLGIFRVALNSWWGPNLAWIHGSFAQVVFAVLVSLAVLMSPSRRVRAESRVISGALRGWSVVCVALVLGQLVLGGLVRHQPSLLVARLHMLFAFVVVPALLWLAVLTKVEIRAFGIESWLLFGLLVLQVVLGVETGINWMARHFDKSFAAGEPFGSLLLRTSHYFVGSLLLAVTAVVTLKVHRGAVWNAARSPLFRILQGGAI